MRTVAELIWAMWLEVKLSSTCTMSYDFPSKTRWSNIETELGEWLVFAGLGVNLSQLHMPNVISEG